LTSAILRLFQSHSTCEPINEDKNENILAAVNLGVHLQLLDFAGAVDVVGDGVTPSVRVGRDEIPSVKCTSGSENRPMKAAGMYCSPMMGVTSTSNLQKAA
jgi:hypothetical protein